MCISAIALVFLYLVLTSSPAIFFDSNEFSFYLSGSTDDFSTTFGSFASEDRLALLRDIRKLRLVLNINSEKENAYPRLRYRLHQFVEQLRKHSKNEGKSSLLKTLRLGMACKGRDVVYDDRLGWTTVDIRLHSFFEHHMFALEVLTDLRFVGTIKNVTVTGVPSWFADCLELCTSGSGGDLLRAPWFATYLECVQNVGVWHRRSPLESHEPSSIYDWEEFADRNDICSPFDIGDIVDEVSDEGN